MQRVVIIGGGFSGIAALRELSRYKGIEIMLLDKHPYHNLQPQVYDLIANQSTVADVTIDLFNLCQGVNHPNLQFKNLRVTTVDFDNRTIHTEEGESVSYDFLILAAGSRTSFPLQIDGICRTNDIKKLHKALYFKQSFESAIFNKIVLEGRRCEPTGIVVVGAGLSGVEIAAEMAYYAKRFFRRGLFACSNMKITLISGASTILPGFREPVIQAAQKRLKELGVEILTRIHMKKADDTYVYLDNGNTIRYSFIIYAGGIEACNLTSSLEIEKNAKGQLPVNDYLQSVQYANVFAVGDIAHIRNREGNTAVSNVTTAITSGTGAARNVIRLIRGSDMKRVYPKTSGTLIALGGYYAVGDLYGKIMVTGWLGYLAKRTVFFLYRMPLFGYLRIGYLKSRSTKHDLI